jgi:hypothetical protein
VFPFFSVVFYGELNPQLGSPTACWNRIGGRQLEFDCSGKTKNVNMIGINLMEQVVGMGGGTAEGRVQWLDFVYHGSERASLSRVQWLEFIYHGSGTVSRVQWHYFVYHGSETFSLPRVQWLDFVYHRRPSFSRVQWLDFVYYGSGRPRFSRVQWLDFVYQGSGRVSFSKLTGGYEKLLFYYVSPLGVPLQNSYEGHVQWVPCLCS